MKQAIEGKDDKDKSTPRAAASILAETAILSTRPSTAAPPTFLVDCLKSSKSIFSFDIETHDWYGDGLGRKGSFGRYGHYALIDAHNIGYARIIQIGWAEGGVDAPPRVKKTYVLPTDFTIAARATDYHGITSANICQDGRPLNDVLREFVSDALAAYEQGARLIAHQVGQECRPANDCHCRARQHVAQRTHPHSHMHLRTLFGSPTCRSSSMSEEKTLRTNPLRTAENLPELPGDFNRPYP